MATPLAQPEPVASSSPEASLTEVMTLEDSLVSQVAGGDDVDVLIAIQDGLRDRGRDPQWVGLISDPFDDPNGERGAIYVLREDSTVWIRSASGQSMVVDDFVASKIGELVSDETGYGDRPVEGVGYGFIDGRFYVYASQGVDLTVALGLAALGLFLLGVVIVSLSRALARSRERERVSIVARRRLTEAREQERLRIAREIHDGPVQDLHAIRLMMGNGAEGPVGSEALRVIHNLRALSENLRPPALAAMGLEAAVESLIGRFEQTHPDVAVSLDVDGDLQEPPQRVGLALFRVVQEGINNAVHHASPQTIGVRIGFASDGIMVSVEDDGTGFEAPPDLTALGVDGHFGLLGMSERAQSLGGRLNVRSRTGGGTRIEAWLPHQVQTD
ncbi:MAG: sensor histidine kinase [Bacteroidota bacterium]